MPPPKNDITTLLPKNSNLKIRRHDPFPPHVGLSCQELCDEWSPCQSTTEDEQTASVTPDCAHRATPIN
jgi:hypothetical protein